MKAIPCEVYHETLIQGKRDTENSKIHDSSHQRCFAADFFTDEGGFTNPVFKAKAAYLSVIITALWMATLAPLF